MARPWFKRRWTRLVPEPAERTSFVLAASLVLALLFWLWQPIGGTAWNLWGPAADALWGVYAVGWALAISSTFLISHSDLFGLRQAWLHARRVRYSPPPFTQRGLYGRIRHPLMAGFLVIFCSAPAMTAGHLLFAATATAACGTCDQVREQLQPWDRAADIVTILLPPGMPWHNIEATLQAAAPGARPGCVQGASSPSQPARPLLQGDCR